MRCLYCIWALLLLLAAPSAAQQASPEALGYTVFLRGQPIGREDVTVQSGPDGTTVVSEGRLASPLNILIRRAEFKYRPDWSAESFTLDADVAGGDVMVRTSFREGMAVTEGTEAAKPFSVTHTVSPQTFIHHQFVFGGYAALARRVASVGSGAELRMYVVGQGETTLRVKAAAPQRIQVANTFVDVHQYELAIANPGGDIPFRMTVSAADESLLRLNVPSQLLDIVRVDLASTTSRTEVFTNPGDEAVTIPAEGFNLAATLTRPRAAAAAAPRQGTGAQRFPAVILVSGVNVPDREGFALGVPSLGQLAGALADYGFMTVRFDKRGYGQSGGRSESATLADHASDARSILQWLSRRKDVDPDRIALVGHGDGAWLALLAAGRERKFAAVVLLAAPSSAGAEFVLEQQRQALDLLRLPAEQREQRVALQRQINAAALTGKGWDAIPPAIRKEADTPLFQSLLAFDPVEALDDVRQPILIVHGQQDDSVPVAHAERLADLAQKESRSKSVELVIIKGVNHVLLPATPGASHPTQTDGTLSADVTKTIGDWVTRTFQAIR